VSTDDRPSVYQDLHRGQLSRQEELNRTSARRVLSILFDFVRPRSVLDVGCGLGTWLRVAQEQGVPEVAGIEGAWLDRSLLQVAPDLVTTLDLEPGFRLERRFDLVICLEVAEHLPASAAEVFVASLAAHADVVLFSAAVPNQGGHHHVNEQFPNYWAERFARNGFVPVDLIRPRVWDDSAVLWWLRQNILVFANDRGLKENPGLRAEREVARPLNLVHPETYFRQVRAAKQAAELYERLIQTFGDGGEFRVVKLPDKQYSVSRVR
jgi:SAM-dependent methyltransferase